MAVTIEDSTVATESPKLCNQLQAHLRTKYQLKAQGRPHHMFGWCDYQDPSTRHIHITQPHVARAYIAAVKMQSA